MDRPYLTIIIPTYRPHFRFASSLLESITRHAVDAEMAEIQIVVEGENRAFAEDAAARFPGLRICWCTTEQIMEDLSIPGTALNLLNHMGKFSFQSLKKIGAVLRARTDWVLVMDSESMFLRDFSVKQLLDDYISRKYVFFTRIVDRGSGWKTSLSEAVTLNAVSLVGGRPEAWYLEYYHWFYERKIWHDIISLIKLDGQFERWVREGTLLEIFENVLYYQYVRTRPELGYVYIDSLEALTRYLPGVIADRARQALQSTLQVVGLLEHITSLFSIDELQYLEALFDAFNLPFVRLEPYTIDPIVVNTIKRFASVCALVSSHRSRVMNRRIAVCISGEFRSTYSNIRSIRDFTSGVACDLFVHTWNSPSVPAIKDGLTPLAIEIEDRPDFEELVSQIARPEPGLKPKRDLGSLCMFRGIERSISLISTNTDQYDLVVRMRPDAIYQESLRDLIVLIADDESFDENTVYVPDRFHSQGINDQFAIGSVTAMKCYGRIMQYAAEHIVGEYFNPEHVMARHLTTHGLRLKTLPMHYLLLRSEPADLNKMGQIMQLQDATWWSAGLSGPDHIRDATSLFVEKAKAIDFMQAQDCFGDWSPLISVEHLTPEAAIIWGKPFLKLDVRRAYKNPDVTLLVNAEGREPAELFVDVREDGLDLVAKKPEGTLFVQKGNGARDIRLVRFLNNLDEPTATITLPIHDATRIPETAYHINVTREVALRSETKSDGVHLIQRLLLTRGARKTGAWRLARTAFILRRGRAQRRSGELLAARTSYARLLTIDPQRAREWVQYGHILKELGERNEAIAAYAVAVSLRPNDADARFHHEAAQQLAGRG